MSEFSARVAAAFAPGQCLDSHFGESYSYRPGQQALAVDIADAMREGGFLIAEAETGIGKTLAYLVPAMHFTGKVLISTHTKALQDQLMHRDLPRTARALHRARDVALLKGRSGYLCPHRLQLNQQAHQLEAAARGALARTADWFRRGSDGDLSGLPFDAAEAGVLGMITATAEQCLGRECPEWEICPLHKARIRAQKADIVIVNHSLLLADASLKAGSCGEVLVEFDSYVIDEAHSLPELASQHFGLRLGRHRLISWGSDMQAALRVLGDEASLQNSVTNVTSMLIQAYSRDGLQAVKPFWAELVEMASSRSHRSEDVARLAERAEMIGADIQLLIKPDPGYVVWSEGEADRRQYVLAPVQTGAVLAEHLWSRPASFVLLSATLRVSGSFDYALQRLGQVHARTSHYASPFDYARQALLYLPRHLPSIAHDGHEEALLDEMIRLLSASGGRAFVLFTSRRLLQRLAPELAGRLPWTVLEQGKDGSRDAILKVFRDDTHSILCGTRSFWEGVDVPGEALSMVIIDKLPFAPPNDPLLRARISACEEAGGNGFLDIQLPEAIAVLRQGVGRLVRTVTDQGVMAILDTRIHTRAYGRQVLGNLPAARVVGDIDAVREFFAARVSVEQTDPAGA